MKKFYIFLFALFLMNGAIGQGSIPALPIKPSAQSNHTVFDRQHRSLNSLENVRDIGGNKILKTSGFYPVGKPGGSVSNRTPGRRELIQLYDSIYRWNWDMPGTGWKINYKIIEIIYDASNNLTSEIYQTWNGSTWENNGKYNCTYDVSNNLTSEFGQTWNGSAWVNSYLYTYTYDANNNLISELYQEWNGSAWENTDFYTYSYDVNDNMTNEIYQTWKGSAWENVSQTTYSYDASNILISELYQEWNGSDWENYLQYLFTYDADFNLTSLLRQHWNGSSWEDFYISTYTYDANSNLMSILGQIWESNAWINDFLETFSYDANNNPATELYQTWNGSSWVNYSQDIFNYDINNFLAGVSYKYYDNTGFTILWGDSTYFYFHTVVIGINDGRSITNFVMIYPNPAFTTITLETPASGSLQIFTTSGQMLLQREITEPTTTIDVSGLKSGVYMVKLVDEKGVQVGKFIKE